MERNGMMTKEEQIFELVEGLKRDPDGTDILLLPRATLSEMIRYLWAENAALTERLGHADFAVRAAQIAAEDLRQERAIMTAQRVELRTKLHDLQFAEFDRLTNLRQVDKLQDDIAALRAQLAAALGRTE
jgi:hypothetical protein